MSSRRDWDPGSAHVRSKMQILSLESHAEAPGSAWPNMEVNPVLGHTIASKGWTVGKSLNGPGQGENSKSEGTQLPLVQRRQ